MEFSIKFDTVRSVRSIVYIDGSQVIISQISISFSEDRFCLKNSADLDEMPLNWGKSIRYEVSGLRRVKHETKITKTYLRGSLQVRG